MIKKFFSRGYIFLVLAFIYAPIFLLVIYSFTDSTVVGVWSGFSLDLYKRLLTDGEITPVIINTLVLALLASVLSTIVGTLGAIGLHYSRGGFGKVVKGASRVSIINAEIVTAISLALIFSLILGTSRSYFSVLIGHMVLCTPFVVLSVTPKLEQMDSSLYEAALDLGATPRKALFKVVLPEILPGIFSGFLLSITLSLDDYVVTAFTKPATFETISTKVYNSLAKGGANSSLPVFRALTTVIFVVAIIVVIIMNIKRKKKKEK